jgi:hypothetical protein
MARLFDDGSSEYLRQSSICGLTDYPFTMALRVRPDDSNLNQHALGLCMEDDPEDYHGINFRDDPDNDIYAGSYGDGGTHAYTALSTLTYVANTWYHCVAVFAASDNRVLYVNGSSAANAVTSVAFGSHEVTTIGTRLLTGVPNSPFSGRICDAAIWDVALTASEAQIFMDSFSPLFIRPQSLSAYWPLLRTDQDRVGGYHMTPINTPTWADHAPLIMPAPVFYSFPGVAGITQHQESIAGALSFVGADAKKLSAKRSIAGAL